MISVFDFAAGLLRTGKKCQAASDWPNFHSNRFEWFDRKERVIVCAGSEYDRTHPEECDRQQFSDHRRTVSQHKSKGRNTIGLVILRAFDIEAGQSDERRIFRATIWAGVWMQTNRIDQFYDVAFSVRKMMANRLWRTPRTIRRFRKSLRSPHRSSIWQHIITISQSWPIGISMLSSKSDLPYKWAQQFKTWTWFTSFSLCFHADDVSDSDGKTHLNYNHRIQVNENISSLFVYFLFIILDAEQEGVTAVESYGLKLAESVRFPPSIVPKAKLIYRDLKAREELENTVTNSEAQPLHQSPCSYYHLISDHSKERPTKMFGSGGELGRVAHQSIEHRTKCCVGSNDWYAKSVRTKWCRSQSTEYQVFDNDIEQNWRSGQRHRRFRLYDWQCFVQFVQWYRERIAQLWNCECDAG